LDVVGETANHWEDIMSLAEILVVVDGAPGGEVAMDAALHLGRKFHARVEVLHVEMDVDSVMPVVGEGMSAAAIDQMMQSLRADAEARQAEAKRLFQEHVVAKKLPVVEPDAEPVAGKFAVCYRQVAGRQAEAVLHRARLADITVLGGPGPDGGMQATFDAVLFDSGRPLLMVPAAPAGDIGATVAVAWNRSRESVRAVHAALPFLRQAKSIIVMTAREDGADAEPSELCRYLAAHGIAARTWAFSPESGKMGEALLSEAAKAHADLLVMGGYGHSRFREMVLGGATRGILAKATVPVFMMH
jgi:nucleotide-binding universal stress UspA family protein